MGIQINGNTNNINAGIGSLSIEDLNELDIVGVATAANFKTGVSNLHNVGLTLSGGQIDVGSNIKLGNAGVITATSFVGSGANLTGLPAGTTINSNTNNYLITGTGSANTLQGESDLQFDGAHLTQAIAADAEGFNQVASGNHYVDNIWNANRNNAGSAIGRLTGQWNGTEVASIKFITGADTTNKDDAHITFFTATSGSSNTERLRIKSDGNIEVATTTTTSPAYLRFNSNRSNADDALGGVYGVWNGNNVAAINFKTGADTTNKDDGELQFVTYSGGSAYERLRITSDGNIGAGGITLPLWTSGGGIHLNDNYGIGFGNGGSGRPDFQLMVTDGSKLEFRCGFGADTADIVMDTSGRLLVGTTSQSISSAELFEVKSTANGFSYFTNNSSSYAPIYIDNEASNNGATLVPIITVTDGGGNRAGLLLNNSSDFNISGAGSVSLSTGSNIGSATERLVVEPNGAIGKVKIQGEANGGTVYGLEIIGNQQTNAVAGCDAGARIIAPVARRMYFELRANDDTDHFAWLGNPDYNTGVADTILMELHPKGYLQKPLQPSFHIGSPYNSGQSSGQVWKSHSNAIYSNVGSHYNNSTGRFTAPVDGQYFFFHWGMSNTTGQTNDVYSRKNGSRDQIGTSYNHAATNSHNQFGCSYVRYLSAGDYVDVYVSNGNVYATTDGRHGGWGGWLIG